MPTCNCLVVSRRPGDAVADAACAALDAERDFACTNYSAADADPAVAEADVVIYCMGDDHACEAVRRWPCGATGRALLVVADADRADIAACLDAGATDFLVAPLRAEELVVRVRRAVGLDRRGHVLPVPTAALPRSRRDPRTDARSNWIVSLRGVVTRRLVRGAARRIFASRRRLHCHVVTL